MTINDNDTQLIFFSGENKSIRKKILNVVEKLFSKELISVHKTLTGFSTAIRQPGAKHKIILILITTKEELFNILLLKEGLNDRKIIIVLPDTNGEFMDQALKLYPRYISHIQETYEDVMSVLEKMRNNLNVIETF